MLLCKRGSIIIAVPQPFFHMLSHLYKDKPRADKNAHTETKTESKSDREQQQNDRGLHLPLIRAIPSGRPVRTRPRWGLSRRRESCHNRTPRGPFDQTGSSERCYTHTHTHTHTHRACLHVSGPSYSHRVQPCWQTAISQGPVSVSLCVFFPLFLSHFLLPPREHWGGREHHWQVYLNIYADREKTRMLSPTRHASISTHALTQPLTWNICFLKPLHLLLELVKKVCEKIEYPDKMAPNVCSCFHRVLWILK